MPQPGQTQPDEDPLRPACSAPLTSYPTDNASPDQWQAAWRAQWKAREFLALAIVAVSVYTVHGFLGALAWGVVFAVATWPLYRKIQLRCPALAKGPLLPLLCTAAMALMFLIPMLFVGIEAANEAQNVLELMKHARNSGVPVPAWVERLPFASGAVSKWWGNHLSDPSAAAEFFSSFDARGLAMTRTVGSQVVHRGTLFFFSILTLFFLYKDGDKIMRECTVASRRAFGRRGEIIGHQIIASIHGTVAGLVLVGVGEGIIMGLVYFFTGVPHPTLLGGATAIAAMIPFCAMIPVALASTFLLVDGGTMAAVTVFAIGAIVIFTADHFVRPSLIGGSTKLPFLWVLLGIVGGAETWGLLGLFLGPAAMATLHLLWRNWSRERGTPLSRMR
ncbi:AI-2E family transporter [Acetobacter conturbans]|uniref:AI-2E family transporter n=1 Tax=Acetobacter conturbans TaxID=1737472 RepID=A0ABX0JZ04_9PROT|nr:AI-2E family transporter [Acetobacter conturbans]NHN87288.1 AI-2E family transporter [Acetobacter conturbans]